MRKVRYIAAFILIVIMMLESSLVTLAENVTYEAVESTSEADTFSSNIVGEVESSMETFEEGSEDNEERTIESETEIIEETSESGIDETAESETEIIEDTSESSLEEVIETEPVYNETEQTLEDTLADLDTQKETTEAESSALAVEESESVIESSEHFVLAQTTSKPKITYSLHMQKSGWLEESKNGEINGNPGSGYRTEAFNISETGMEGLGVYYRAYVVGDGWTGWVSDGEIAGTTGQSKPVTILQLVLNGSEAANYDIYYSVYAAGMGWLDWAKNGINAGTSPEIACNIEGIKIKIVSKGSKAPGETANSYVDVINVMYYTHMQSFGDTEVVSDGEEAGVTGLAKRMEGLYVYTNSDDLNIKYRGYIEKDGWGSFVYNGNLCGTTGQAKRIEAFQISLTGAKSDYYSIYYRVHVQTYGWLDWAKDGEPAGTNGYGKRIEAIQIVILPITQPAPGETTEPFITNASISYTTHVQSYGWLDWAKDGETSGTVGEAKRVESIKIDLSNPNTDAKVKYRTHVQSYGWQDWVYNDKESGTTGLAKRMEAIEIQLIGNFSRVYDVYYRVHVESYGWLGWAKNGETAGTTGLAKRMEAIEIVLVGKGGAAPGETGGNYISSGKIGIDVSMHNGKVDWDAVKESGLVNFAIIRCGYRDAQTGVIFEDSQFKNNIDGAIKNNIPVGIYFYSQAITKAEAIEEANWVINKIKNYKITYPVIFDFEHIGENRVANLGYDVRNNIAVTFLDTIKAAGYQPMMYASQSGYIDNWDVDTFVDNYDVWVARYRTYDDVDTLDKMTTEVTKGFNGSLYSLERAEIWQFAQTGRIPGISEYVDLNICYKAY